MSHYALVTRSEPLVLDNEEENKVAEPYRDELTRLYETYAKAHPNPRLAQEYRERDKLLELAAASRKRKIDAAQEGRRNNRGFFGFWRTKDTTNSVPDPKLPLDNLLIYSDIEDDDDDDTSLLCGTQRQLDRRCIPQEAYTAARFHLASVKTQRGRPIVVRSATEANDPSSQTIIVITGVGQVAEFVNNRTLDDQDFPDEEQSLVPVVKLTSDREDLVSYISSLEESPFDLSYVRAISLGPNFLAISWGLLDGVVVMYRRVDIPDMEHVGWESVAMFGPGDDSLLVDSATGQISSSLLRVTDIVALLVEHPYDDGGARHKPPAATLAVSRLGGFVDLLPLMPRLWSGPVLTPANYKHSKSKRHTRKRKRRHNEPVEHYCLGKLQNLSADKRAIVTVATLEHHSDVLCLDAHRTQVGSDTQWDEEEYPDSPPAEYVLASSGTMEGRETVTFWGVSTVFEEDVARYPTGVSLHVTFIDKIDLGPVGPDISIFASNVIGEWWRKPRRIRLRPEEAHSVEDEMDDDDGAENMRSGSVSATSATKGSSTVNWQLSTLSTPAPVTCLRFGYIASGAEAINRSTSTACDKPELLLAALDWNGGVTVIDCGKAIRVASHNVVGENDQAHDRQDDGHEQAFALSRIWLSRSRFMEWTSTVDETVGIRWWRQTGTLDSTKNHEAMYLAMILGNGQLRLVDLQATNSSDSNIACTVNLSSVLHGTLTASIVDNPEKETLSFVLDRRCVNARAWNGSATASERILSVCAMERMDAALIIQSLAQSGQYIEAIDAAEALNVTEREGLSGVIDLCHKRLWEQGRAVEHLTKVTDDVYVVKQALALYHKDNRSAHVSLQTVREASIVALKRARNALNSPEMSTHIQRNYRGATVRGNLTPEEEKENVEVIESAPAKLTSCLIGLCTYSLLCSQYGTPVTVARFQDKFLSVPVSQLAFSFAKKGDVASLTLLFLRHRNEIAQYRLEVLDHLPIAASPSLYCHLLPVYRAEGNGFDFFMPREDEKGQLRWSQMASYLHKCTGSVFFVDKDDEEIVLDSAQQTRGGMTIGGEDERDFLATWYTKKALHIQSGIGSLPLVIEFCDCGLKRLGEPHLSSASLEDRTMSAPFRQLYALRTCARHLSQMLNDGVLFPSSLQLPCSSSITMSTEELRTMNLSDLLTMILGESADSFEVLSKYRSLVQPLIAIPGFTASTTDSEEERRALAGGMDNAIASFCLQLIPKAVTSSTPDDSVDSGSFALNAVRDALAVCATIASASRTTIRKSDRIIKEKAVLMQMVLSVVYETALHLERWPLSYPECRFLIDMMWQMYECLPRHLPRMEASDEDIRSLQKKVDQLNCDLIGVDLLSQWTASHVFSFLVEMQHEREAGKKGRECLTNVGETEIVETRLAPPKRLTVGLNLVSAMCRGFCQQLRRATHPEETQIQFTLLQDLISDVEQLNKWCFQGSLPFGPALQTQLFRCLLEEEHFELLGALLSDTDSDWIDKMELQNSVLAYVNEAMFKEDDSAPVDGSRIQSAILCQDTLGPLLPDIQLDFHNMRRYLDAAAFLDNEIGFGQARSGLHPRDMRDMPPIDVVELVLAEHPRSIILGCLEWEDEAFGEKANADIIQYFRSTSEAKLPPQDASLSSSLPPLPGGAILRLAAILGLESASAQLILKSRITHHAVSAGLFAASAAVCMSLVCDPSFPWEGVPDANIRLRAVAEVVSASGYDDVHMKKELCTAALQRCRGPVSACDSGAFDVIMRSFALLETQTSRFQHAVEEQNGSVNHTMPQADEQNHSMDVSEAKEEDRAKSRRSDFLVFRAAGMFVKTARKIVKPTHMTLERSSLESPRLPLDSHLGNVRLIDHPYRDILTHYSTDVHELFSMLQQHLLDGASQEDKTMESVISTLGRLLLFWCISDSLEIDEGNIHGSSEQLEARMVLAMGTALLLHLEDKHSGLSLVKELQNTLETETSNAFENLAAREPPSIVIPDANIVKRLLGRGYSVNGARRSAVMTNNESYESAMAWAVSHSLDPNFDDPIVLLKQQDGSAGPGFVDQATIHRIQETLRSIHRFLEGKQNIDSLLSVRKETVSIDRAEGHVASHSGKGAFNGASLDLDKRTTHAPSDLKKSSGPTKAGTNPRPPPRKPTIRSNDQAPVASQIRKSSASGTSSSSGPTKAGIHPRPPPRKPPLRSSDQAPVAPQIRNSSTSGTSSPRSTSTVQTTDRSLLRQPGESLRKQTKSDRGLLARARPKPPSAESSRYALRTKTASARPTATKLKSDPNDKKGWDFDDDL